MLISIFYILCLSFLILGGVPADSTPSSTAPATTSTEIGQCRLTRQSNTALILKPYNGNRLFINGLVETIPSVGVTVNNTGLTADTVYYVYAFMDAGAMKMELSTLAPSTDSRFGHRIKTSDTTRTYVGNVRTSASSDFSTTLPFPVASSVRSWFNPIHYIRTDVMLFNSPWGQEANDTGGVYAFTGAALSSSAWLWVPFNMTAKIENAKISIGWTTNNIGNKIRLVHFDDGPKNIVQIVELVGGGTGKPINSVADITSALRSLQKDQSVFKHIGFQTLKINATVYTLHRVNIEILWALDDARE